MIEQAAFRSDSFSTPNLVNINTDPSVPRPGAAAESPRQNDLYSRATPSVSESQEIVGQRIQSGINETTDEVAASGASAIETLVPQNFSPENVANRILATVAASVAELEADDPARQERLDTARAGAETGFNNAVEQLESLEVFDGEVRENAEETFELVQRGFDQLAEVETQQANPLEG